MRLRVDTENGPASGALPEVQQPVLEQTKKTHRSAKSADISRPKVARGDSPETRLKKRLSHLGKKLPPFSAEHRRKLSESHKGKSTWLKGKHLTPETKEKLRQAHLGRISSAATKAKLRQIQTQKWLSLPRVNCLQCGRPMRGQQRRRGKYCSLDCHRVARTKVEHHEMVFCIRCQMRVPNPRKLAHPICPNCSLTLEAYKRKKRKGELGTIKEFAKNHPKHWRISYQKDRKAALRTVAQNIKPRCVRCGCDDTRLLEINHRNGGGRKDYARGRHLYHEIKMGIRPIDDLEILCKPCNALHFLELKYGALPMKVSWNGQ